MKEKSAVLTGTHFMNGDIACAEGAIAAGCRFFAGYPITPATEIAERMAHRLPEIGGTYIQMEDELASMAAIVGASCAGAKAMTSTSGPGFSLMMENLGLAIMMEVPCVIVNVQRGGPSTGLPTHVGQQDMMQARWGSHGDYALVAYVPSSPQEMFEIAVKAFNTAERLRVPVLIMADESVGHMTERVDVPEASKIPLDHRKKPSVPRGVYQPFLTNAPNGTHHQEHLKSPWDGHLVPEMAIAGEGFSVHMESLTHDASGRPAITAAAQAKLVPRLKAKVEREASWVCETESYFMKDAEVAVVAYGITSRSAREAVAISRARGVKAGLLRLITAWPFPEAAVESLVGQVKGFVVAELNLGQMVLEVDRVVGKRRPVERVLSAGGELLDPLVIADAIGRVAR